MNTWKGEVVVPTWENTVAGGSAYGPDIESSWTAPGQWARDVFEVDGADIVADPAVTTVYAEADQAWFDQWDTVIWAQPITYKDPQGQAIAPTIRLANAVVPESRKNVILGFMVQQGMTQEQRTQLQNALIGQNGLIVARRIANFIRQVKGYPPL